MIRAEAKGDVKETDIYFALAALTKILKEVDDEEWEGRQQLWRKVDPYSSMAL